ncbi:MAG: hypothetical protein F4Y99_07795 [Acidimicrobiaceae bacterium]|nr:hypothetical protein [Acidimicrobiaceae bacterium]MYF42027.1 hypothetical protein [Acidimicrobiaceae bacterium]MYJ35351.1 hypothetical protein [Acidimicrobiaceae bacterium]
MNDSLTDAIADAALHIPGQHLVTAAAAIQDFPRCSPESQAALINVIPASNYRRHATTIAQAWNDRSGLAGAAVAAALRSAAATAAAARAEHAASLVWTGPTTEVTGLRATRSVLDELVANATRSLVLVSFVSYDVAELTESLANAIARGVDVTLILETPDDPGGPLTVDTDHPFKPIKATASFYRWPSEAREVFFASTARLHAKCVIADRSAALITSANLTSAGINDNIELGVLIEAGPLPIRLSRHLDLLIEQGILEPA